MGKIKKVTVELTEKQARLLSYVCNTFPRLIEGQDWEYQQLFEQAWEKRCKEATGKPMSEQWDGGWYAMREHTENLVKEIKQKYWGLAPNAFYGIHYDDSADIIWDIYASLRYHLWLSNPDPDKPRYTVDAFPASQIGSEPLCKVKIEEDGTSD